MLSKKRLNPTANAETVLPSSMPVNGTTNCGAYHGCGRMMSSVTNEIMMSMVTTRLRNTGPAKPFGTPFARERVICTAAMSMNATSSSTSHGLFERMTYSMMKPIAHRSAAKLGMPTTATYVPHPYAWFRRCRRQWPPSPARRRDPRCDRSHSSCRSCDAPFYRVTPSKYYPSQYRPLRRCRTA